MGMSCLHRPRMQFNVFDLKIQRHVAYCPERFGANSLCAVFYFSKRFREIQAGLQRPQRHAGLSAILITTQRPELNCLRFVCILINHSKKKVICVFFSGKQAQIHKLKFSDIALAHYVKLSFCQIHWLFLVPGLDVETAQCISRLIAMCWITGGSPLV